MIKKILAFMCAVLLLTVPVVFAEDDTYIKKEEILEGLGILPELPLNHDNFIKALGGFSFENAEVMTGEEIVESTGLLKNGEKYEGKSMISLDEALKYAVRTLGYSTAEESMGGYLKIAYELNLTKGITVKTEEKLSYEASVKLLYNMLEAAPLRYAFDIDGRYVIDDDSSLLELKRNIYKITGRVTSNRYTSIYNVEGTENEDYVKIDGLEYYVGETNAQEMLGLNVIAYVQKIGDEYRIVSIVEDRNEILEIAAKDIVEISTDFSKILYVDGDRYKNAKLTTALGVIYNGVSYGEYNVQDFKPEIGKLRLIDNTGDGRYDLVEVYSYESMIVESVDATDGIITNEYNYKGCLDKLSLDTDTTKPNYVVYNQDGEEVKISNIKPGDVLSVAKSKNEMAVKIYISGNEAFTGKLQARNDEEYELTADELTYSTTPGFLKFLTDSSLNLKFGSTYIFYLDCFENIVYAKTVLDSDYSMLYKVRNTEDISDTYEIEFMDMNGMWHKTQLAEKVKVDDVNRLTPLGVYEEFNGKEPQIVKLKTNANGEINSIDTAAISSVYSANEFVKDSGTYTYRLEPKCFDMKYYLRDNVSVVVMPLDATSKEDYYIASKSYFKANKTYSCEFYDASEFGFINIMSVKEDNNSRVSLVRDELFIVSGIDKEYSESKDDVVVVLRCNVGDYKNLRFEVTDKGDVSNIKRGDVVRLNFDNNGRINVVSKQFSLESFTPLSKPEYYGSDVIMAGTVEDIDLDDMCIRINTGTANNFRLTATSVIFYDKKRKLCETEVISELSKGDDVLCRLHYGRIVEIICVTE